VAKTAHRPFVLAELVHRLRSFRVPRSLRAPIVRGPTGGPPRAWPSTATPRCSSSGAGRCRCALA